MSDYAVAFVGAATAASVECVIKWDVGPLVLRRFRLLLLGVIVLDIGAAALAVLLLHSVPGVLEFTWLRSGFGWFAIGLGASLVVRGNIAEVAVGDAKLGVGFGFLYVPLRAPIDSRLFDAWYSYRQSHRAAVLQWASARIARGGGQGTYNALVGNYRSYVEARRDVEGSYRFRSSARQDAESDIAQADEQREYARRASILLTLVVRRGIVAPIYQTFGEPGRGEIRRIRRQQLLHQPAKSP